MIEIIARFSFAQWVAMIIAFRPTLRLYGPGPLWGLALPLIALTSMICTIESALQFACGRSGAFRARVQAAERGAR